MSRALGGWSGPYFAYPAVSCHLVSEPARGLPKGDRLLSPHDSADEFGAALASYPQVCERRFPQSNVCRLLVP